MGANPDHVCEEHEFSFPEGADDYCVTCGMRKVDFEEIGTLRKRMESLEEIEKACIKLYVGEITKTEWRHVVRNGPLAKKLVALAEEEA